jgi:hypothetical protein
MKAAGITFFGVSPRVVPKELKSPRGHAQVTAQAPYGAERDSRLSWVQIKAAVGSIVAQVVRLHQVRPICVGASARQCVFLHVGVRGDAREMVF